MGMTIDKAIEKLSASVLIMGPEDWGEARHILISTARKYQHVQEIMCKEYASDQADVCLVQRLTEIREVLEDGECK